MSSTSILLILLVGLQLTSCQSAADEATRLKGVAAAMEARELYPEAAAAYRRVANLTDLAPAERAQALYAAGNMLLDKVGDARGALAAFTEITVLAPEENFGGDLQRKTAAAMERVGNRVAAARLAAATSALDSASAAGVVGSTGAKASEVMAEVNGRRITRGDLEKLGAVPAGDSAADQRMGLVQSYVASLLAVEAARRSGLESDPQVEMTMRRAQEMALQQAWLQRQLSANPPDSGKEQEAVSKLVGGLLRDAVASGSARIDEAKVREWK